ncbi:hypothetical protein [Streptomyces hydrogenans]|uniref:hypothetical protein n=1 Tax=Streptomyces hydrogenans TaxID=1873719 RepID=UPI0035D79B51
MSNVDTVRPEFGTTLCLITLKPSGELVQTEWDIPETNLLDSCLWLADRYGEPTSHRQLSPEDAAIYWAKAAELSEEEAERVGQPEGELLAALTELADALRIPEEAR